MSSRISRFVFGGLASRDGGVAEACVAESALPPVSEKLRLPSAAHRLLSDERLVELLRAGDADALTQLFARHSARIFGVARRVLRNDAEAEDAVQQVFLEVYRSVEQFDAQRGGFERWLLMFAYHRIFNRRRQLVAKKFFATDPLDETWEQADAGDRTRRGCAVENSILVQQVLSGLKPRQRRTIELVYYEGLTAEEVAARTGETVRVVRHNLYRGLAKLREALARKGDAAEGKEAR